MYWWRVSFVTTNAITNAAIAPDSNNLTEAGLKEELDSMYLKMTGLYMNITQIDSAARIFGNAKTTSLAGFNYTAKFSYRQFNL